MKKREDPMKNGSILERALVYLNSNPGEHRTAEIAKAISASKGRTSSALTKLASVDRITNIHRGIYCGNDAGIFEQTLRNNIDQLRKAEANAETIDILLNTYDIVLAAYQSWVIKNVDKEIDFEKQLLFIENFKWLTMIVDKLMKRWALVHVGYDTNTRQAQEDAKVKTQEREKAALENAPLRDRIMIVGKYDPEAEELLDCIPSSLEQMTDDEAEKVKV